MNEIGKTERETQRRLIQLFRDELGYKYLGDWADRVSNSNIEEEILTRYLREAGYSAAAASSAIYKLNSRATDTNKRIYERNQGVYNYLRYGIEVDADFGKPKDNVWLIDWKHPEKNHFAIAEEVTLKGGNERRPDLVLYINGLAIGTIELKNSRTSIGEGINQSLSNQSEDFNAWFYSTVQFVFAGNDSEGLQYGAIKTPQKFFLQWKEDEDDNTRYKLDKYLLKMCEKKRILELIYDFVLFDGGIKKLPRVHQYMGVKKAQEHVAIRKGGIIWHTQGSGKSIVMVLLARWILENNPNARIAIITDRDELDKQILRVLRESGTLSSEKPDSFYQANSGRDLLGKLKQHSPRIVCSLVHKFGKRDTALKSDQAFEDYIKELEAKPTETVGEIFVFVDECHRTQSGRLHKLMKAIMPNAVFIGFTGTPLLKKDKSTSLEIFGGYIHTYKFSEAVDDEVVLDLIYEARDIDQRLTSQEKIDQWFEMKTKGLNDWQKDELKKKWGTMQSVLSSKDRMEKVVGDIIYDFACKPRLSTERGNAMLVASNIYEACKYYTLFAKSAFKGRCAVITSYDPQAKDISKEEVGANTETDKQFVYNTYTELLKDVTATSGKSKTETYEDNAKQKFTDEPANMKLLIVVDKLLTGFDAPSCTFLYIDKSMQDHGLFQAICRTNRLDGDDKDYGYIVDYKDLFKKVENAIAVYSSELDKSDDAHATSEVLLKDRLQTGKERLDNAIEALLLICEPVESPKGELQYLHYFCGNTEIPEDLKEREPKRTALYKGTVALLRAYGNIADDLSEAGYSESDVARIKQQLKHYVDLRDTIRNAAGETLDLKPYEADMRHLIDTYIEASEPRKISPFDNIGLLDLIVKTGIAEAITDKLSGMKGNREAIAETIENNVRKKIITDSLTDPAFYERMSKLLNEVIADRKAKAIAYEEYLKRIAEIVKKVGAGKAEDTPATLDSPGKRAIYNKLKEMLATQSAHSAVAEANPTYGTPEDRILQLALRIDQTVKRVRPDSWRRVQAKEAVIKSALFAILQDDTQVENVFRIIENQTEY
jgi:type I restriction enzyme, R subunit